MAISITRARARAKESSTCTNEKAKRGPLSNSEITPRARSTIESTKPTTRSSSKDHNGKTPERRIPSYVNPKTSPRTGSQPQFLKQLMSGSSAAQKPSVNRKPASAFIPTKPKADEEVTSSRPHRALISSGRPHRTTQLVRTSSTPNPSAPKTTLFPKPISKTTSNTHRAAKPKPISSRKGTNAKKTAPTTKKKVDHAPVNSTNTPETSDAAAETSALETGPQVTEQESGVLKAEDNEHQEVEKVPKIPPHVDNTEQHEQQHKVEADQPLEKVPEIPPHVDSTEQHEQQQKVEPDQPQIQADDESTLPSAPEGEPISVTEVREANGELEEEKTKDESTGQGESNNWRHLEEQPATDGDVEVKEKEKECEVIEDEESENNNEGKILKEKEGEETRMSEDKTDGDELVLKTEVEEVKTDSIPPKEEAGKESQARVNAIEETASKLLETKKDKVKALAGAFQSVIDHQTSSK